MTEMVIRGTAVWVSRPAAGNDLRRERYSAIRLPMVFAEPLRASNRGHAEQVTAAEGIDVEYIKREKVPNGGPYPRNPRGARDASRSGASVLGDGALLVVPPVARKRTGMTHLRWPLFF
jgi:hypothetical protein